MAHFQKKSKMVIHGHAQCEFKAFLKENDEQEERFLSSKQVHYVI
jgi:hypothetical protein